MGSRERTHRTQKQKGKEFNRGDADERRDGKKMWGKKIKILIGHQRRGIVKSYSEVPCLPNR
jgi:hypothetical protein